MAERLRQLGAWLRRNASTAASDLGEQSRPSPPSDRWGTVFQLLGGFFVHQVDMLIFDRFKALPALSFNQMPGLDGPNNLETALLGAHADYLVLDLTAATERLKENFAGYAEACRKAFAADRIILIRSHIPRFWIDGQGQLQLTDGSTSTSCVLRNLEDRFVAATGCQVIDVPGWFLPNSSVWSDVDGELQVVLERRLRAIAGQESATPPAERSGAGRLRQDRIGSVAPDDLEVLAAHVHPEDWITAADYIADCYRSGLPVDEALLRRYFATIEVGYDDLIAIHFLAQNGASPDLISDLVAAAVSDQESQPARDTRQRVANSRQAVQRNPLCRVVASPESTSALRIVVPLGQGRRLEFEPDGCYRLFQLPWRAEHDVNAIVDGIVPITPESIEDLLRSWRFYLERGRRGITSPLQVSVGDGDQFGSSFYWLDWARVFADENVEIVSQPGDGGSTAGSAEIKAVSDLSWIFSDSVRILESFTGLADQLREISGFWRVCTEAKLEVYLDDLTYTYILTHNGYEAPRLAPELQARRITSHLSEPLRYEFKRTARALPGGSLRTAEALQRLGMHEAILFSESTRLFREQPNRPWSVPVLAYNADDELAVIQGRFAGVQFYCHPTLRDDMNLTARPVIRELFDWAQLESDGLSDANRELRDFLISTPTVGLHVRRGDFITGKFGAATADPTPYRRALEMVFSKTDPGLIAVTQLAVFSDDIPYVREHAEDYGITLAPDEVTWVDWNHHFESIYDLYLLAHCAVVIGPVGKFARTAALMSKVPNSFVGTNQERTWWAWQNVAPD